MGGSGKERWMGDFVGEEPDDEGEALSGVNGRGRCDMSGDLGLTATLEGDIGVLVILIPVNGLGGTDCLAVTGGDGGVILGIATGVAAEMG